MPNSEKYVRELKKLLEDRRRCEDIALELDDLFDQTKDIRLYLIELKNLNNKLSENLRKYLYFTEKLEKNRFDTGSYRSMFFLYYQYFSVFNNLIDGIEKNNMNCLKDSIVHALYDGPKDLNELEHLTAFSKHSIEIALHDLEEYIDYKYKLKNKPKVVYSLRPVWKSVYEIHERKNKLD